MSVIHGFSSGVCPCCNGVFIACRNGKPIGILIRTLRAASSVDQRWASMAAISPAMILSGPMRPSKEAPVNEKPQLW